MASIYVRIGLIFCIVRFGRCDTRAGGRLIGTLGPSVKAQRKWRFDEDSTLSEALYRVGGQRIPSPFKYNVPIGRVSIEHDAPCGCENSRCLPFRVGDPVQTPL